MSVLYEALIKRLKQHPDENIKHQAEGIADTIKRVFLQINKGQYLFAASSIKHLASLAGDQHLVRVGDNISSYEGSAMNPINEQQINALLTYFHSSYLMIESNSEDVEETK